MHRFEGETLILDGIYPDRAAAEDTTRRYLLGRGADPWDVDAALGRAVFDRAWWSDTYDGFTHDCGGHNPSEGINTADHPDRTCWDDARQVTVMVGFPPAMRGVA